jgi:hypothetical protein
LRPSISMVDNIFQIENTFLLTRPGIDHECHVGDPRPSGRGASCPRASRTYLQEAGAADFWMCSLLLGLAGQLSAQRLDLAGRWQPRLQVARLPASAAMVTRGPTASVEGTPGGPGWPPRRRKIQPGHLSKRMDRSSPDRSEPL